MAEVPQVLILGVVGLLVDLQRNVVCFRILNLLLTAVQRLQKRHGAIISICSANA